MDKGSKVALTLERMVDGGFLITDGWRSNTLGMSMQLFFACTTIDEALAYMRDAMTPIEAEKKNG
jgi:hypothetical protein